MKEHAENGMPSDRLLTEVWEKTIVGLFGLLLVD